MAETTTLQFNVPDMDCQGCISSITTAVQRIDANATVAANLDTKRVTIASNAEPPQVAAAIEKAGFTVQAV